MDSLNRETRARARDVCCVSTLVVVIRAYGLTDSRDARARARRECDDYIQRERGACIQRERGDYIQSECDDCIQRE